jgi:light-regulated signal transduction histidine kinase (bacteriophytochrome)
MRDPSSAAANKSLAAKLTSGDINPSPEHEIPNSSIQRQHKSRQATENDADRIRSSVMRLISNSTEELEELTTELQKLQEFLKCETERVQHEIDSVLSGVSIIIDTIAPWKSPATSAVRNSPTNQGSSARDKLKHWPPPPAD